MKLGIVASMGEDSGAGTTNNYHSADLVIDFINGVYRIGVTDYAAADVIDHPEYIDAVPLVETPAKSGLLLDTNNIDGASSLLAPFLTPMVGDGWWTILLEVDTYNADDWGCPFFMGGAPVTPPPTITYCYLLMKPAPELTDIRDPLDRLIATSTTLAVGGIHRVAITRDADHIAISVDGDTAQADSTSWPTDVWTEANFGSSGGAGSFPDNTLYVRQCLLWTTPKDDGDLAGLTAL